VNCAQGEALADTLTDGGFDSTMRQWGSNSAGLGAAAARAKREERLQRLRDSTRRLAVAWALAAVCLLGHAAHMFPALPAWLKALCGVRVHAALSVFALLGPGRQVYVGPRHTCHEP
jgi:Cu+-exporting ATPase